MRKKGIQPHGNNNYGNSLDDPREHGVITVPDLCRVAIGSDPSTCAHNHQMNGMWDLFGNVSDWVHGCRVVDGEIQIIPDNDAALLVIGRASEEAGWKAVLPDGILVPPRIEGSLKWDYFQKLVPGQKDAAFHLTDSLQYQQTLQDDVVGEINFRYVTVKEGVSVPEILKQLAIFLSAGIAGNGVLTMCNIGERMSDRSGCYQCRSLGGMWHLRNTQKREFASALLGFRYVYIEA